ncbi:hypothetical protein [Deinococcus maricopensis]|uniref:Uncharacterized protein n=1 Tax=Deinococcus maricopensis (strain DSM 21211 / LMG 22137 / NRRL B-23946 / LB-34) TaxID=709986 RepID=E8U6K8_DEIML|nr:hypothetical protein [Deinococcus maricopensis]ADV66697.1 hypothetical protein Deima_1044 [Deinococcus maricopensis DSM 21211]
MNHIRPTLLATLLLGLTACSGTAPTPGTGGTAPTPTPGNGSTITHATLLGCPDSGGTQDTAALGCMNGKVVGTTLSGEACTLTIGNGASIAYTSPASTFTFTPGSNTTFTYGASKTGQLLMWSINDTTAQNMVYADFRYNYGTHKLEINTKNANVSSSCNTTL